MVRVQHSHNRDMPALQGRLSGFSLRGPRTLVNPHLPNAGRITRLIRARRRSRLALLCRWLAGKAGPLPPLRDIGAHDRRSRSCAPISRRTMERIISTTPVPQGLGRSSPLVDPPGGAFGRFKLPHLGGRDASQGEYMVVAGGLGNGWPPRHIMIPGPHSSWHPAGGAYLVPLTVDLVT
jgi:hypothetical protein